MQRDPSEITFIGLGAMGLPMARRLATMPNIRLTLYDVSAEAIDVARGFGRRARSVEDGVADADVVFTMLPADEQVRAVARQLKEHAPDGAVLVELSTIHPATIAEIAESLRPRVRVVAGSCMKSVAAAKTGDLTLFIGGEAPVVTAVRPALDTMASRVSVLDHAEDAKTLKLVNNLIVSSMNLAIAEMAILGSKYGLPYDVAVQALDDAGLGGWALHNHIRKHLLANDLGSGYFSVQYMRKDVTLAAAMIDDLGCPRFLCGPIVNALRGATLMGHGDHYHPIAIRWLERMTSTNADDVVPQSDTPRDDVLATLVDAMSALEHVIAIHGLDVSVAAGIARTTAAKHLDGASAATAAMRRFASDDTTPITTSFTDLAAQIDRARNLVDEADVPAMILETAHDFVATRRTRETRG